VLQDRTPALAAARRGASVRRPHRGACDRFRALFDDRLRQALRELGLSVRVERDIAAWKRFILGTEWAVVNSAVDPAYHDFAAGEVIWTRLVHGRETVATQVVRIVTTADFIGMIRDHTLFFGANPSGFRAFRMLGDDDLPRLAGRVAHLSGLYIRPHWRRARTADGMRLVAAWTGLTHSFTARTLMADWSVTLLERRVASPRMVRDLYGYPHAIELFEAYVPDFDRRDRVTIAWMSAAELAGSAASRPPAAGRSDHPGPRTAG
jgi:hypothetical protein